MAKVLIVYFSLTGRTQRMAEYIAEGVRFGADQAVVKKTSEIQTVDDVNGYEGYIFGSPTYHQDMAGPVKTFLFQVREADLKGRLAGAFGSYTHSGDAPAMVFDTMRYVYKMRPFYLGPFNLLEAKVGTQEGMRACHDYGRTFAEKLAEPWTEEEEDAGSEEAADDPTPWALT
jgi:flavodoxin